MKLRTLLITGLSALALTASAASASASVHAPAPRAAVVSDCSPASANAGETCGTWRSDAGESVSTKPGFTASAIGVSTPGAFHGTDLLITHVAGPGHPAIVQSAPNGIPSGMYLTDIGGGQVRFVAGTPGLSGEWIYTGDCDPFGCDGPFQNAASLRFLTTNGNGNNLTTSLSSAGANKQFQFLLKSF